MPTSAGTAPLVRLRKPANTGWTSYGCCGGKFSFLPLADDGVEVWGQGLLQLWTVGVLAAHLVDVDFIHAQLLHQDLLSGCILFLGTDSHISDFHF